MGKTRAYGADCALLAAFEASYGMLPAARLSFKESSLGAERPLGYDPLLGQGRDAQDPFYEAIKDEGDIGVPLDVRALGFWLKGLFGAPASADNGDGSFNHVFTSGGTLPSLAIEIGHHHRRHPGDLRPEAVQPGQRHHPCRRRPTRQRGGRQAVVFQQPGAGRDHPRRRADRRRGRDRGHRRGLSSANLDRAWKCVKANKGAAGVDRQTIQAFLPWFAGNRDVDLLTGRFRPSPVRGVQIPKPGGGVRQLGIPTVRDRLVQQAILQVLEPLIDPTMSASSFGFRPGKNAHQAVFQGQRHVAEGYGIVVDIDLEKFFDRVNHDILMARLARRIGDRRLLRIIRRFLQAGMLQDGVSIRRNEGTPQGGPLSPLLANILLDDLDKELEKRGHRFCRYADDCNIYVRSQEAGERVMASVTRFLETRLRLRVNREKSAVAPVEERSFLGYQLTNDGRPRLSRRSFAKARDRLREITARQRAVPLGQMAREVTAFLTGWMLYFRHAEAGRDMVSLGKWVRRKLRCAKLRQCEHSLGIRNFLIGQGVPVGKATQLAASGKGWWRLAASPPVNEAMPNKWLAKLGLIDPVSRWEALQHDGNRRGTWSVRPVV